MDPARLGLGLGLRNLQNSAAQYDVPNSVLLARIDHVASLLEDIRSSAAATTAALTTVADLPAQHPRREQQPPSFEFPPQDVHAQPDHSGEGSSFGVVSAFTGDGFGRLEIPEAAARTSACESLLQWPALRIPGVEYQHVRSFALQSVRGEEPGEPSRRRLPLEHDAAVWPLCQRFLALIHVKNPVLDVVWFKRHAREAAEYGAGWDGPGCLVVRTV